MTSEHTCLSEDLKALTRRVDDLARALKVLTAERDAAGEIIPEPIEIGNGVTVYRSATKPYRYFCPNCRAKDELSVLQQMRGTAAEAIYPLGAIQCPTCNAVISGKLPGT